MEKRYIFFIGTLCNGGAERVVSLLASKMAEQGRRVEILTYYESDVAYELNPKIQVNAVETLTGEKNKLKNLIWLRKYFKNNAKTIISFLAPFNMLAIAVNLGAGTPIIVADRNDPEKIPSNCMMRSLRNFLYMFADEVILQTEKNKAYFNKIVQKKSSVIYNPVSLGENAGIALRTKKDRKIVTAGRLMQQKNQKMLVEAFYEIVKKYPEYTLVIYGDGPCRANLEDLIKKLGIEKNVFMPGNTRELHDQIKSAEIFVLSSDYEGMPNALIEAMCLGIPVISTKVSGATDLIIDHENGLLVDVGNCEGLKNACIELIANKDIAQKCAENAVQLNDELEISKITRQWIDIIEKW